MNEHPEYKELFQDDDMLESSKDTKFISASKSTDFEADEERVFAKYEKGDWITESQVLVDGEWYVSNRNTLYSKPEDKYAYSLRERRPVKKSHTMFSNLSTFWRIILTPVYGLVFMYFCLSGKDVNLQILGDDEESN